MHSQFSSPRWALDLGCGWLKKRWCWLFKWTGERLARCTCRPSRTPSWPPVLLQLESQANEEHEKQQTIVWKVRMLGTVSIEEHLGRQKQDRRMLGWSGISWLLLHVPSRCYYFLMFGKKLWHYGVFQKEEGNKSLWISKSIFFLCLWEGFVHFPLLTAQISVSASVPAVFNVVTDQQWVLLLKDLENQLADINSHWERTQLWVT